MPQASICDVAIIGGGFSGALTTINALTLHPAWSVGLIDKNPVPGLGLAYGTSDPDHLLNVRAAQMGAFPDRIGDFWDWLQADEEAKTLGLTAMSFAPRRIYGRYLRHLLRQAQSAHAGLQCLSGQAVAIRRGADGFAVTLADCQTFKARQVVLAAGNFPPPQMADDAMLDPYDAETHARLAEEGDVLIVGTGLTSLDIVATLVRIKARGAVHLLSRHGLLPREHVEPRPYAIELQRDRLPRTALALYRLAREEIAEGMAQGLPWQSVVDAFRPYNQDFWQALPPVEQRRFMRHLRAYWDVHRHRCAPQIMAAYRKLESAGRLKLHHGSIIEQRKAPKGWTVTWRPRGTDKHEELTVKHVLRCTGPQADVVKLNDTLVQDMLGQGLVVPDELHLGLHVNDAYTALDATGNEIAGLYVLGSLLKGKLFESVAVPELRQQAANVAKRLS